MNAVGLGSAAVVAGYVLYLAQPRPGGSDLFPLHPSLMVTGVVFALTLGISILGQRPPHPQRRVLLHFACNLVAGLMVLGGFAAITLNKEARGKEHFTSRHGQLGLAVTGLLVLQLLGSAPLLLTPSRLAKIIGVRGLKQYKMLHRYSASAVYVLAMTDVFLGFYSNWWNREVGSGPAWYLFVALTFVVLATVVAQVRWG